MSPLEPQCPYHRICPQWIGGPACLNFNWERMYCYKEKKKITDQINEALKKHHEF